MKKLFKQIAIFLTPILTLIILLFFFNIMRFDFKYAHQSSMVYNQPIKLHKYLILSEIKDFTNSFIKEKKINFKKINLFVEEQKLKKLSSKTPLSTKEWVKAKIGLSQDKLQDVQLRYRGDNPANWMFKKKSFKIKTKKKELINNIRSFDYLIYSANQFSSYYLSKKMSLITQNAKIAQINLNGKNRGLYIELDKIDESFLRNNNIMPINIYKGENHSTEKKIGLNENLFNNPRLWSKVAVFNQKDENDYSDLKHFLSNINKNNFKDQNLIDEYLDIDYFSKYEAFLTLTQNNHHDWFHNLRLISDPWKGKVYQIITDPIIYENIPGKPFLLDFASNDLSKLVNSKSNFIHKKYKNLYEFLNEKKIIEELEIFFLKHKTDLKIADRSEPYMFNRINYIEDYKNIIQKLRKNKKNINTILENDLRSSFWTYNNQNKNIELIVGQQTPLSNIELTFNINELPNWIGVDQNFNNKIDQNEKKYFLKNGTTNISIPLIFYANRLNQTSRDTMVFQENEIINVQTKFNLISSNNKKPIKLKSTNYFTKKEYFLNFSEKNSAVRPSKYNKILFEDEKKLPLIELSGNLNIKDNKIFENPVKILKGTTFHIYPNKHIIFKNKVEAVGSKDEPIIFKKFEESKLTSTQKKISSWGTIALLGRKTEGSLFNNVIFKNGSGGIHNQLSFISMFSLHDVQDVKIYNCDFYSNLIYDDTVHVIYSNNVKFKNINIFKAFSDAVDVDISQNIDFENIKIEAPGNDGIDFMKSSANIINLSVIGAKDKGVSIGENSSIKIKNSTFDKNFIGIAVKDNSKATIIESNFMDNYYQLAGYAKNWRYSGGGAVRIKNSNFLSKLNRFSVLSEPGDEEDKKKKELNQNSFINISDSRIEGEIYKEGNNILLN
jgi:hypothetical protein